HCTASGWWWMVMNRGDSGLCLPSYHHQRCAETVNWNLKRAEFPFCAAPVLLSPETREGHRAVRVSRWTWVAGCGIATAHGTQQTAGRQRHLQADLPRSLGSLPAAPSTLPGSPRAGRDRQNARLWHPGGGLHHISVPALPGRETGGVQL